MPVTLVLILLVLLVVAVASFVYISRRHLSGHAAVEKQIEVLILDKQSVAVDNTQPGADSEEYWLYVQPVKGGPKRDFQIGPHYFHALNPGDSGTLTYRGRLFLHFALKR
ncbi:DUF2500 domain-containing protein [Photobacterium halotolerans]|uniref:DUF2500 family protein n=1 Tax=Photobacterium halotolerans TaxID=265726 RepID=A0A7X4WV81_9GAMM|nr:DUF2500 domain-containing protein [Photobacterium halotolerans]NAW65747.1 DUF2500 family protein [Photobacterium halotolerans]NAW88106.1 DUF2500 family protein [Photobacterium halotolerans]